MSITNGTGLQFDMNLFTSNEMQILKNQLDALKRLPKHEQYKFIHDVIKEIIYKYKKNKYLPESSPTTYYAPYVPTSDAVPVYAPTSVPTVPVYASNAPTPSVPPTIPVYAPNSTQAQAQAQGQSPDLIAEVH